MKKEDESVPKLNHALNRRDFLRLSGLSAVGIWAAACAAETVPTSPGQATPAAGQEPVTMPVVASGIRDVPRERTLIVMFDGNGGSFLDVGLGNPYLAGIATAGWRLVFGAMEPLFYYGVFSGEVIPWLATGYEYNEDFTELTIFTREGAEWSDGEPFDAHDIVFTINMLIENAPLLRNSSELQAWVQETSVIDDTTCRIVFSEPKPRFWFTHLCAKFGTGIWWVPEHIFKDVEDVTTFTFYDMERGWPVHTGPYQVVDWRPEQQIIDRLDDWWGAKIGFAELPEVERIIKLPWTSEERAAQLAVVGEIDSCLDLRASTIKSVLDAAPHIITHTHHDPPYGYIDWWPTSLWFNCDDEPYNDPNVRWAVSYAIDREQMVEVALEGSGILTELPFPYYDPLMPYIEAAAPLLEKYPTNEFNLDKSSERMTAAGYSKDGEGFWAKNDNRIEAALHGWAVFNDIGPVIAEQLRRGGFSAEYVTPADVGTRQSTGVAKISFSGHGGSINDPYPTLDMYTSKFYRPTGEPAQFFSRWRNEEYDAIVDEMATFSPSPDDPVYMDLYLHAMEIWLENLVDCPIQQWLHRIPMNTTYWTNWPDQDNPYVNGAFWTMTIGMILHNLKAAKA
jgi:peptide/nickel transport system substrate-binding protein